jgi:polyisoprenoid-binding protein YceI
MTATATTQLTAGTWAIDPVHSSINFSVRHLMVSKVRGKFDNFSGAIVVAEDGTTSVNAEIAVDSVNTGNDQRDAHIKSPDFFDVETYPIARFAAAAVEPEGDNYVLNGVNPGMGHGEVAGFEASVTLNRKDFGIDIDMPLQTGGAVVGDKVTITIDVEAVKQA